MKKLILILVAIFVVSLLPVHAGITCDSGDLNTTCTISTVKYFKDGDVIQGPGTLIIEGGGDLFNTTTIAGVKSASLKIDVGSLVMRGGAMIRTYIPSNLGLRSGDIVINVQDDVSLSSSARIGTYGTTNSGSGQHPHAGNVYINATTVTMNDTTQIRTLGGSNNDFGYAGNSGNVTINADWVRLYDTAMIDAQGGFGFGTEVSGGDGGDIYITANEVTDESSIAVLAHGGQGWVSGTCDIPEEYPGNGGYINITALENLDLEGDYQAQEGIQVGDPSSCPAGAAVDGNISLFYAGTLDLTGATFDPAATIYNLFVAPMVSILVPLPGQILESSPYTVGYLTTEGTFPITTANLYINDVLDQSGLGNYTVAATNGAYTAIVEVIDSMSNRMNSSSVSYTMDIPLPPVSTLEAFNARSSNSFATFMIVIVLLFGTGALMISAFRKRN